MIIVGSTGMQEDEWVNPFQPSVSLYIETSHLSCWAKETIDFYMKCKTELKNVNWMHYYSKVKLLGFSKKD